MSREIEERVVQMKFEKGNFEKEIQTSIYKLDELKKGLDFKDAVRGFDNLDKAARSTDISALGKAVEDVRLKFSFLEVFALRVMDRISNSILDAANSAKRLITELTLDQITPGWDKYAQKTSSVQTIMAATAAQFSDTAVQMEVVNAQLDKLNWFTDETSYNFVDMVNNIGKFTSNNIALDQSVTAMQGIANWAAISGANAQEASRAMYNLAQALATGTVKLIDWKSIENANMATTEFKQTVIDIATELGTLKKVGEDTWTTIDGKQAVSVANFNEGLSKGWFTNDVLMRALNKYGAAAEKLNEIYEALGSEVTTSRIVSSVEQYTNALNNARKEATEFGLDVEETNKKVAKAGESVAAEVAKSWGVSLEEATEMLAAFDDETMQFGLKAFKAAQEAKTFEEAIASVKDAVSTGWMKTFELLFGSYTEAKELWTNIANTLYDIFAASGDLRNEMLAEWAEEGGRAYFTDTIYAGLAAIMSILTPIKAAWEAIFGRMTAKRLLDITKKLHAFTLNLVQGEESIEKIARVFRGLFSVLDIGKTLLFEVVKGGFGVLQRVLKELNIDAGEFAASIGDGLFQIRNWIKQSNVIPVIFNKIGDALIWVIREVRNFVAAIQEFGPVKALIEGLHKTFGEDFQGIGGILQAIGGIVTWLWNQLSNFKLPTSLDDIFKFFSNFAQAIRNNFEQIGIDFTWIDGLFTNFSQTVTDTLGSINVAFNTSTTVIGGALTYLGSLLSKVDWAGVLIAAFGVGTLALLWKYAEALQGFADAFKNVTGIGKSAKGALDAIKGYFGALKDNVKANNVTKIAISITLLAIAFGLLSRLSWEEIGKGAIAMVATAGALLALSAVFTVLNNVGFSAAGLTNFLLSLGAAMLLLSVSLKSIPIDEDINNRILKLFEIVGILSLAVTAMSIFTKGSTIQTAGLVSFAAAIFVLIQTLKSIGAENIDSIYAAVPVVAAIMAVLAVLSRLMTYTKSEIVDLGGGHKKKTKSGGAFSSIIGLVIGLIAVIQAIKMLSKMDPASAMQGVILMIPVMIALGQLFKASAKAGQYASSAGKMMLFLSAGLAILIPVVKGFANMELGLLVKGGITITALSLLIMAPLVALSKYAGKYAAKAGMMILEIAGALAIIQLVVKTLGKIDFVELLKGTASVAVLIASFSLVLKALSGLGKGANESNVKAMTKIMVIIGIISTSVLLLTVINPYGALAVTAGLSAMFVSMGKMFATLNDINLPDVAKLGTVIGMIAMIGLVIGLVSAISNWQSILATCAGLSLIFVALASVAQIIKNSATTEAMLGKLIILRRFAMYMGLLLAALATGTVIFTKAGGDIKDLLGITTALTEIIVAFGLMGKLIGKLSLPTARQISPLIAFVAAMAGIVAIIGGLVATANANNLDISGVLLLTTAMSEIMLAMGVAIRIMNKVEEPKNVTEQIIAMGLMVSAIGIVLGILAPFVSQYDMKQMLLFTTGISEVILALGVASTIMGLTKFELGITKALAMSILVGAIGATLGAFSGMTDPNSVLPLAKSMSLVLVAVSAAALILSLFPADPNVLIGATFGIAIALLVIAGIAAVMAAIGALVTDTSVFNKAAESFTQIGRAIGGFIGGIIGGLAEGISSGFPGICENISTGMTNLKPFFDGLEAMPPNAAELCWALVGVVTAMTAAEFITGLENIPIIGSLIKSGSENLKENFTKFGEAIKAFSDSLGTGFNGNNVKLAAEAISILATTERDMSSFKTFMDTLNGEAGDLGKFGDRLEQLGNGLQKFANSTAGLDNTVIDKATTVTKTLIELEKGIPKKNGALQAFFGEVDIGQFGDRLGVFGEALANFSAWALFIDYDAVENARVAAKTLVDLENDLAPVSGLSGLIFGNKDLSAFGSRLVTFAQALVDFSSKTSEITSLSSISRAKIAAGWLIELENEIDQNGGLKGVFFGNSSFKTFGDNLSNFGSALVIFDSQVKPIDLSKLQSVVAWIRSLINLQDLKFAQDDAIKAAQTILDDIRIIINNNESSIRAKGMTIIYWVAKGMETGTSAHRQIVESAAISMANEFIEAFEAAMGIASPSIVMSEEGKWVVKGLAEGITDETSAEEAAQKKAQNIVSAFNTEISKLTSKENTSKLEFQLWQLTDGKNATEVEIAQKQLELENEKLAHLAQTVGARKQAMEAIAKISGESSAEYQSAYQDYLQAQIDMLNQQNSIDSTYGNNNTVGTDIRDQMVAYANFMKDNAEAYKFLGKSQEELENAAYKAAYGLDEEAVGRKRQYEQVLAEYQSTFEFLGKSREELEAFAKEQTGWKGIADNVNSTMSDTAKIIEENINAYSIDIEATLEIATAEIIANSTKKGSAASGAAIAGGISLGEDMAGGINNAVQQALGGGQTDFGITEGKSLLEKIMDMWGGDFSIAGVDLSNVFSSGFIDNLTENTKPIADALYDMVQNGIDTSGVKDLVETYGGDTVSGFINGIKDEAKKSELLQALKESVTDSVIGVAEDLGIQSPSKVTTEYGEAITEGFAVGISNSEKVIMVRDALDEVFSVIATKMDEMSDLGMTTVANYANGLNDRDIINNINTISSNIANNAQTPFSNVIPNYKTIGLNSMIGFREGIVQEGNKAIDAARAIAAQVESIMRSTLQVRSPSRVTEEIGRFVGIGLANGINESTSDVANAVESMTSNAINSLDYAAQAIDAIISSDDSFSPVITPILDMDDLKKEAANIPGLLNKDRRISIDTARLRVSQINASKNANSQNGSQAANNQTNYTFTQNNYSPKALNRVEIYRQTNNQFARIKEATKR